MLTSFYLLTLFLTSLFSKKLNFATFNALNLQDNLGILNQRLELKQNHLPNILNEQNIDVLCLQEIGTTISSLQSYINHNQLMELFPYHYTILDSLTPRK